MQQFFFFKIKRGQNKFDPEYYFVYRFSFARSLGHVHLLQSRSLMIMRYLQKAGIHLYLDFYLYTTWQL